MVGKRRLLPKPQCRGCLKWIFCRSWFTHHRNLGWLVVVSKQFFRLGNEIWVQPPGKVSWRIPYPHIWKESSLQICVDLFWSKFVSIFLNDLIVRPTWDDQNIGKKRLKFQRTHQVGELSAGWLWTSIEGGALVAFWSRYWCAKKFGLSVSGYWLPHTFVFGQDPCLTPKSLD